MLDVALQRRQISGDSAARIVVTGHTAVGRPVTGARRAPKASADDAAALEELAEDARAAGIELAGSVGR